MQKLETGGLLSETDYSITSLGSVHRMEMQVYICYDISSCLIFFLVILLLLFPFVS
jgi:hypothetical protein